MSLNYNDSLVDNISIASNFKYYITFQYTPTLNNEVLPNNCSSSNGSINKLCRFVTIKAPSCFNLDYNSITSNREVSKGLQNYIIFGHDDINYKSSVIYQVSQFKYSERSEKYQPRYSNCPEFYNSLSGTSYSPRNMWFELDNSPDYTFGWVLGALVFIFAFLLLIFSLLRRRI